MCEEEVVSRKGERGDVAEPFPSNRHGRREARVQSCRDPCSSVGAEVSYGTASEDPEGVRLTDSNFWSRGERVVRERGARGARRYS